jgi:hypothetical protein
MTFRELADMADGRQRAAWERMAAGMALFANANRDPKSCRKFEVDDFNPFANREKKYGDFNEIFRAFCKDGGKNVRKIQS